jgi:hypothetical protein
MLAFDRLRALSGIHDASYQRFSAKQLNDHRVGAALLEACRLADLGIENIRIEEREVKSNVLELLSHDLANKIRKDKESSLRVFMERAKFSEGKVVGTEPFDLESEESEGTKKFFRMMGPILDTLENGYTVIVDELEAKLHPLLTRAIVRMFHTPEINAKNAQLIFCTHDTGLLSHGGLRRDQIWFVEKSAKGASTLYPLSDFENVRKDTKIEANYIAGRFGAIPFLGGTDALVHLMRG